MGLAVFGVLRSELVEVPVLPALMQVVADSRTVFLCIAVLEMNVLNCRVQCGLTAVMVTCWLPHALTGHDEP
jgi:hypothetical protein